MKIRATKGGKIGLVLLAIIVSATLATAAVLTSFGTVNTSMTALQSVVTSDDGVNWHNYDQPISRDLGDVVHCTDYCYKAWIKNQACVDAELILTDICIVAPDNDPTGVDISHYVFGDTQVIELTMKDSEWNPTGDPIFLEYNTCGTTFDYTLSMIPQGYTLVYYIDQEDPYVNWGKVFVIGDQISGSYDIPSMPYAEDLNYDTGAKFWLVPTVQIDNGQMTQWTPSEYYYEINFGIYIDCDGPVTCMPCYPLFTTNILKAESTYCWISCYHVAFNIVPGQYNFETIVDATEL